MLERSRMKKYDFPLEDIPRYHCTDPKGDECINQGKPVVIEESNVIRSAMGWSLEYLAENQLQAQCPVLFSSTNKFKYFRDKPDDSSTSNQKQSKLVDTFNPPTSTVLMKVSEFHERLKAWKEGDNRMYLQVPLSSNFGPKIVHDFVNFRWQWVHSKQKVGSWGRLTSNVLFVGMAGNITPCHFDEQENLFAQVIGYKRCILFPPEQFECLYPYPVFHPHDRQSQVDFDEPDYKRFPKFKDAKGFEAVIGPGDVLYIPTYWWHHIESLSESPYTISINFWHKSNTSEKIIYPLNGRQKVALMRNIEKTLSNALNDPDEVGPLLRALVLGRYTE